MDDLVLDGGTPIVHVVLVVAEGGVADVGLERREFGLDLGVADKAVAGAELLVVVVSDLPEDVQGGSITESLRIK